MFRGVALFFVLVFSISAQGNPCWSLPEKTLHAGKALQRAASERGLENVWTEPVPELTSYLQALLPHLRRQWAAYRQSRTLRSLFPDKMGAYLQEVEDKLKHRGLSYREVHELMDRVFLQLAPLGTPEASFLRPQWSFQEGENGITLRDLRSAPWLLPLPLPFGVSFRIRYLLFRQGTPPVVTNLSHQNSVSVLDQNEYKPHANLEHDLRHAEVYLRLFRVLGFRYQSQEFIAMLNRFLDSQAARAERLPDSQREIAYFFLDQLLSEMGLEEVIPGTTTGPRISDDDLIIEPSALSQQLVHFFKRKRGYLSERHWARKPFYGGNLIPTSRLLDEDLPIIIDHRSSLAQALKMPPTTTWEEIQSALKYGLEEMVLSTEKFFTSEKPVTVPAIY